MVLLDSISDGQFNWVKFCKALESKSYADVGANVGAIVGANVGADVGVKKLLGRFSISVLSWSI